MKSIREYLEVIANIAATIGAYEVLEGTKIPDTLSQHVEEEKQIHKTQLKAVIDLVAIRLQQNKMPNLAPNELRETEAREVLKKIAGELLQIIREER